MGLSKMYSQLSEFHRDGLMEMLNLGVGAAAAELARFANSEVTLTVPTLREVSRREAADTLVQGDDERICGVTKHFSGETQAEALILFPEAQGMQIVRVMLQSGDPRGEIGERERAAIIKIGNVIVDSCISAISDMLETGFDRGCPALQIGTCKEMLDVTGRPGEPVILLSIDVGIKELGLDAYIALSLDEEAIATLKTRLDAMYENLIQDAA